MTLPLPTFPVTAGDIMPVPLTRLPDADNVIEAARSGRARHFPARSSTMRLCILLCLVAAAAATVTRHSCRQPRKAGPCDAAITRWFFSAKSEKCLKFTWGGCLPNGNNFKTLAACSRRCCRGGCGNPCRQPRKVGPCRAAIPRWYFSAKAGKCLPFTWGGCKPNGNNFKTLIACNKQCSPCRQPRKVGPCKARVPRWFFSVKRNKCLPFFWGGCLPNGNNFKTRGLCSKRCCHGGQCGHKRPQFCSLSAETGPCRAYIPRFFFDGKKCRRFIYGGCYPSIQLLAGHGNH